MTKNEKVLWSACMRLAVVAAISMGLAGCANQNKDMVDGKAVVLTPENHTCYLLEIEREDAQGNELDEGYLCVTKAVYDKNKVGEEYVSQ